MRKKIVLCLLVVTMLALALPVAGMAGPLGDVNQDYVCITMMVKEECTHCDTLLKKWECIRKCVNEKLAKTSLASS